MADNNLRAAATRLLRSLLPVTPGLVLKALLGALLFFCGIIFGFWLMIRYRRR